MNTPQYKLLRYVSLQGDQPYTEWLITLKDRVGAGVIRAHVDRMQLGHFGKSRFVGEGVWELKIHFGPGYRVYYFKEGKNLIILLCGGDKGSQGRDIEKAKIYAEDYRR